MCINTILHDVMMYDFSHGLLQLLRYNGAVASYESVVSHERICKDPVIT